jgi:tetratricopeptide (TPR) repeat protein
MNGRPVIDNRSIGARPRPGTAKRLTLLVASWLASWLTVAPAVAPAEDRVILQRAGLSARVTITGVVEDYTGAEISIRTDPAEPVRAFPSSEVIEIQTAQTDFQTRGLRLLAEGNVAEAVQELEQALKHEPRAWVRREILAALIRCGLRKGDYGAAGARFLALVKNDPATRHFRLIPLIWAPESISREAQGAARLWLEGATEPARLIGASLLYDDAESGKEARAALKQLSSSSDGRIRGLAQMQAWREDALRGNPGARQTAQWQRRVDELSEELRAGPSYLLGRAYLALRDYELAAASFLWIPLIDDHDFRLAARACFEAGRALEAIGQSNEARTLYLEVIERFGDTPSADEARAWMKRADGQSR